MLAAQAHDWDDDDDDLVPNPQGYELEAGTRLLATHCMFCGRPLRDPESIENGCGPVCAERFGVFSSEGPPDERALAKWLGFAKSAHPDIANIVEEEGDDRRKAVSRLIHAAGNVWKRQSENYAQVLALVMELSFALGYPGTARGIRRAIIEGRQYDEGGKEKANRKPSGIVLTEQDGRWVLDLPYIASRATWGNIMGGLYRLGAQREPNYRVSFDPALIKQVLNVLVDELAGTLGVKPDGHPFVVPFQKVPITDAPRAPTGPSGAPAVEQRPKLSAEQVPRGAVITLNDGRKGVVKWAGKAQGQDRIGFVTEPGGPMHWAGIAEVATSVVPPRVQDEVAAVTDNPAAATMDMPELPSAMYGYQKEGAAWLFERRAGVLAFEQGLGKTITSIAVTFAPALVVCPASLRPNWVKEFAMWRPDMVVTAQGVAGNPTKFTDQQLKADVLVTSYEGLGANMDVLSRRGLNTLVVDEAHKCKELLVRNRKDPKTNQWSQHLDGPARAKQVAELSRMSERRYFLTGTPLINGRPYELWPLLHMSNPRVWYSQKKFWQDFCGFEVRSIRGREFAWYHGAENLADLRELINGKYLLRKTKALLDLPEKWRQSTEVTMDSPYKEQYARAARELMEWLVDSRGKDAAVRAARASQLVQGTEMRRLLGMGKITAAVDFIESHHASTGRPLVVMAHHKEVIDGIRERLAKDHEEIRVGLFTGQQNPREKEEAKVAFQEEGTLDVLLCSIQAAGVGITLTRAEEMLFVERTWVPFEIVQAEDRIHRIGTKNKCTFTYLNAAGTLDPILHAILLSKMEIASEVLSEDPNAESSLIYDIVKALDAQGLTPNSSYEDDMPEWATPW